MQVIVKHSYWEDELSEHVELSEVQGEHCV